MDKEIKYLLEAQKDKENQKLFNHLMIDKILKGEENVKEDKTTI